MITHEIDPQAAYGALAHLEAVYPGFSRWWAAKVTPGLADGTRRVLADVRDGRVVAAGVFKRSDDERKICTIWASEAGTASTLCREGMRWLGTDRPSFTVPHDLMPRYRRLLSEIDAGRYKCVRGVYRADAVECVFDGGR
jgi:hypothetical protein